MKPGRELDALIVEKVMGLPKGSYFMSFDDLSSREFNNYNRNQGWSPSICPEYSTSIVAAWEVVEKTRLFSSGLSISEVGGKWEICRRKIARRIKGLGPQTWDLELLVCADTASHAICLAALRAMGYEVKD